MLNHLPKLLVQLTGEEPPPEIPPDQIPCKETSDREQLCEAPVVSVLMLTFNHEAYIREAIEGVVMQKTDFAIELVIGEDASSDKTREICFEYQRKYPRIIRVLWSKDNLYATGGNGVRALAHCRGKYIAYCEGDDYWTDPDKLQAQVNLLEKTGAVMCVAFNDILDPDGEKRAWTYPNKTYLDSLDFFEHYFHTSTYLLSRETYLKARKEYGGIYSWYDTVMLHCMASMGKVALLPKVVSVRRVTGKGIATSLTKQESALMALCQYMPLYCFGPRKRRHDFGLQVLYRLLVFSCKTNEGYSEDLFLERRKYVYRIFIELWFRLFPSKGAVLSLWKLIAFRLKK